MAINQAIIRIRRGLKDELQIDKLLPGELAMATDAPLMWFCWSPGRIEEVPTSGNVIEHINEIVNEYIANNDMSGGYYIPEINNDGSISWTPSKEGMHEIPDFNIVSEVLLKKDDVVDNFLSDATNLPASARVAKKLHEKFINEEIKNVASINEFKEFLLSRVVGDSYCIYAASGCSAVFGVNDLIMGSAIMHNGNCVFDGISHWNSRRWYGHFTSYDDTWGIKEE